MKVTQQTANSCYNYLCSEQHASYCNKSILNLFADSRKFTKILHRFFIETIKSGNYSSWEIKWKPSLGCQWLGSIPSSQGLGCTTFLVVLFPYRDYDMFTLQLFKISGRIALISCNLHSWFVKELNHHAYPVGEPSSPRPLRYCSPRSASPSPSTGWWYRDRRRPPLVFTD